MEIYMNKLTLLMIKFIAVIALVLAASTTFAAPRGEHDIVPDRVLDACGDYREMTMGIAKAHQYGTLTREESRKIMESVNFALIVDLIYDQPRMSTIAEKEKFIHEYANASFLTCIKNLP
jgi:hypothetical protein